MLQITIAEHRPYYVLLSDGEYSQLKDKSTEELRNYFDIFLKNFNTAELKLFEYDDIRIISNYGNYMLLTCPNMRRYDLLVYKDDLDFFNHTYNHGYVACTIECLKFINQ